MRFAARPLPDADRLRKRTGEAGRVLLGSYPCCSIQRGGVIVPLGFRNKETTMKKLWLVTVASLALSTSAMGQPYHKAPPPPPPACNAVASWTDVNANVCIKYVCAGGGFQIRCLPAPPLR